MISSHLIPSAPSVLPPLKIHIKQDHIKMFFLNLASTLSRIGHYSNIKFQLFQKHTCRKQHIMIIINDQYFDDSLLCFVYEM